MAWEIDQKCLAIVWVWTGLILFFYIQSLFVKAVTYFPARFPDIKFVVESTTDEINDIPSCTVEMIVYLE